MRAERRHRAERLRDYFELQLQFAERMAGLKAMPLAETVALYTNFHKRFGLGAIEDGPPSELWLRYAHGLEQLGSAAARLDWTLASYVEARDEIPPADRREFGCFSCDPPDAHGALKIHFQNKEVDDDHGPLSRAKMPDRLSELGAMFAFVRQAYPSAKSVKGGSWLYNLEAYRRLFPPAYGASRAPPTSHLRLNGSSSWGQFLDHREAIKPDLRDAFLCNLDNLDAAAPWRSFPIQALLTTAPVEHFYAHYEVGD